MSTRNQRIVGSVFLAVASLIFLNSHPAQAARTERSIGLGMTFYSGEDAQSLTPPTAFQVSFSGNVLYKSWLNFVNHFDLGYLMSGENFGGSYGAYSGYTGNYEFGFRFNFAKGSVQPFLEMGTLLGLYVVTLDTAPTGFSKNQTSLKYGYTLGTGFDWVKGGNRGGKGWGVAFNYFAFLPSPGGFEFARAGLDAKGIRAEVRYLFGGDDDKK